MEFNDLITEFYNFLFKICLNKCQHSICMLYIKNQKERIVSDQELMQALLPEYLLINVFFSYSLTLSNPLNLIGFIALFGGK